MGQRNHSESKSITGTGQTACPALETHQAFSTVRKALPQPPNPGPQRSRDSTAGRRGPEGPGGVRGVGGAVPGNSARPLPSTPPIGPPHPTRLLTGFASHIAVAKSNGESLGEGAGRRVGALDFSEGPREPRDGEASFSQASFSPVTGRRLRTPNLPTSGCSRPTNAGSAPSPEARPAPDAPFRSRRGVGGACQGLSGPGLFKGFSVQAQLQACSCSVTSTLKEPRWLFFLLYLLITA